MIALKLIVPLAAAALIAGCGGGSSHPTAQDPQTAASSKPPPTTAAAAPVQAATVTIKSFAFGPPTIVVKRGGKVTWKNDDNAEHTATANDRSFDTNTIEIGKARTVTFSAAGTYEYHCDFHPFMKATVVVR